MFDSNSKFLIVDDSDVTRSTIRAALDQLSLKKVDEAADGEIALGKLKEAAEEDAPFDLVFCDINMPNMDGFELLEICRGTDELRAVPFLMVTTESQKQAVIRAVMQGVSGYIVKPFGIDELKSKIRETFDKVKQFNAAAM